MTKNEALEALILLAMERMQCACHFILVDRACDKCELLLNVRSHFPIHTQLASEKIEQRKVGRRLTVDRSN